MAGTPDTETLYRLMIENVGDYAIFALDAQGRVLTWNEGARRLKGYESHEIIGQPMSTFYPPEPVSRDWPGQELRIAEAQGRFEDEGWRIRKDGSRFWANVVITSLVTPAGELIGFSKITRDLTDRRNREESLRQSEERFRLMVESVKDYAIFMLDPEGRVASWNAGAERIKGYRASDIIGRHFSTFYPQEALDRGWPAHELAQAKMDGRFEDEGWRVRKDGTTFWANVVITALHDSTGRLRGFAKVTRDLSERRRVESLEATERRSRQFLAMLAHELRNPLAPITASMQVILRTPSFDTEAELAKRVLQRQVGQLSRLVDDLLDVSRVTQSAIALRRQSVDLRSLAQHALESARPLMEQRGHRVDLRVPSHPVLAFADEDRLVQVLVNLLNNAAKYTPREGRIEIVVEPAGQEGVVRVRDTGIGIPPDLLETVFDLFVQGERSLARTEGGLGVGLTLVKQLVHMHGGTVEAHSDGPGKGSEFVVRLPLSEPGGSAATPAASTIAPSAASTPTIAPSRRRVLIVDDNVDAADMLAILLREYGHEVRTEHDGPSALEAAAGFRPEFVLLDIGLPGMTGYELARRLREIASLAHCTFIAVTGYGQPSDRAASESAGISHHFVKPADAAQLHRLMVEPRPVSSSAPGPA